MENVQAIKCLGQAITISRCSVHENVQTLWASKIHTRCQRSSGTVYRQIKIRIARIHQQNYVISKTKSSKLNSPTFWFFSDSHFTLLYHVKWRHPVARWALETYQRDKTWFYVNIKQIVEILQITGRLDSRCRSVHSDWKLGRNVVNTHWRFLNKSERTLFHCPNNLTAKLSNPSFHKRKQHSPSHRIPAVGESAEWETQPDELESTNFSRFLP